MKEKIGKWLALTAIVAVCLPAIAWAKPAVAISIVAEKEVVVMEKEQKVVKRVAAEGVVPGDVIYYTINFVNKGEDAATNVVISDPIPQGTAYIPGSASENYPLTFSIDGGKTFKKPSMLTYELKTQEGKKEKITASPESYTHIRWDIPKINGGEAGNVLFTVKVK